MAPLLSEVCAVIYNGSNEEKTAGNRREKKWAEQRDVVQPLAATENSMLRKFLHRTCWIYLWVGHNDLNLFYLCLFNWGELLKQLGSTPFCKRQKLELGNSCKLILFDLQHRHLCQTSNAAILSIIFIFKTVSKFNDDILHLDSPRWNSFSFLFSFFCFLRIICSHDCNMDNLKPWSRSSLFHCAAQKRCYTHIFYISDKDSHLTAIHLI